MDFFQLILQVSPVFIEDTGETSTDTLGTTYKFPYPQHEEPNLSHLSSDYDTSLTVAAPEPLTTTDIAVDEWNSDFLGESKTEVSYIFLKQLVTLVM